MRLEESVSEVDEIDREYAEKARALIGVIKDFARGETHEGNVVRVIREFRSVGGYYDEAMWILNSLLLTDKELSAHRALEIERQIDEIFRTP